jgi:phosphoribosyl 1,2-cyclic phosphodiesterase
MSLVITSLNSGSNGNCYYIANQKEAVLIDVGLSCRETEKRMQRLGLSMEKIKAIFISHEHTDHIRGLEVISRKYKLPVYITSGTHNNSNLFIESSLINSFKPDKPVFIGDLKITPFAKYHDAADPHSFIIEGNEKTVGVFTDIGTVCDKVIENFKKCHAIFLEANYDDKMLEDGFYPYYLKERIKSNSGHLSNAQAIELFVTHKPEFMSHVILSHLSKDNNSPQLVEDLFNKHAGNTNVIVASRDNETKLYYLENDRLPIVKLNTSKSQLELF